MILLVEKKFIINLIHIIFCRLKQYLQKFAVHGSKGGREAGDGSKGWVVDNSWGVAEGNKVNRVGAGTQSQLDLRVGMGWGLTSTGSEVGAAAEAAGMTFAANSGTELVRFITKVKKIKLL